MSGRPNIVLITTDQHRGDCYGFAGRGIRTPNFDELAASATWFRATTTPCLVCQPARASLLTGLLPLTHGVWDNGVDPRPELAAEGFASLLTSAGYATGLIGKAHLSSRLPYAPTGTREDRTSTHPPDWNGPYMGFHEVELTLSGDIDGPPYAPPYGQHYERWLYGTRTVETVLQAVNDREVPTCRPDQTWHSRMPVAWHVSSWCADRAVDFVRRHSDTSRPFCLWLSFADPHHPFDCPEPWSRVHDPRDVDLPVHRTLDLDVRPWWHAASLAGTPSASTAWAQDLRSRFTRVLGQTDEQLAHMIANYYGMISLIDDSVGRVLDEIDHLGMRDTTVVIVTSDHGDWLGDHGLLLKGPMAYEGLLTVGSLIRGPGWPAGSVIESPVSLIDLPATILDAAGLEVPAHWHGRSLAPVAVGQQQREWSYTEWDVHPSRCGVPLRLRTVRTRTHKLTLELESGAGELYDLDADPGEMENRFRDGSYGGVQAELIALIHARPRDEIRSLPEPVGIG